MDKKTIAIDFDGVIHNNLNGSVDGPIIEGAVAAIEQFHARGYRVVIFTAREDLTEVEGWLAQHLGDITQIDVTNRKPSAIAYIDDRAVRFTNWRDILNYF